MKKVPMIVNIPMPLFVRLQVHRPFYWMTGWIIEACQEKLERETNGKEEPMKSLNSERGSAFVIALVIFAVLLLLGSGYISAASMVGP